MKNILISIPGIGNGHQKILSEAAGENAVRFIKPGEVLQSDADWADIIVGNLPPRFFGGRHVELMQLSTAGADLYVKEGVLAPSSVLACCTGAYSQSVAEHSFAATLMLQKNLHLYRDSQSACSWTDAGEVGTINGATVIVVGLGDIGKYYARMVKALGAYVIGVNRRGGEKPEYVDELYTTDSFDKIAGRGDIIFSVMPSTPQTVHFYTEERFALMKPTAIFINSGRGSAVSEQTLYNVLSKKVIACAAVDVLEREPLPSDSPLWGLKNLLITPHASGDYHLPSNRDKVVAICAGNLKAFLSGQTLINVVDFASGYKK